MDKDSYTYNHTLKVVKTTKDRSFFFSPRFKPWVEKKMVRFTTVLTV